MPVPRVRVPSVIVLTMGMVLGWVVATLPLRSVPLQANGTDRSGESVLATGPIMIRYDDRQRAAIAQDAIYYLDYKGARLLGTIPALQPLTGGSKMLDTFAERDLVADFKLDPEAGPKPHFLVATAGLGPYSEGMAPLFVFETTTNQVAAYRLQQQMVGTMKQYRFDLVELQSLAKAPAAEVKR